MKKVHEKSSTRTDEAASTEKPTSTPPPSGDRPAPKVVLMPVGTRVRKRPPTASEIRHYLGWAQHALSQWFDGEMKHEIFDREMSHALIRIGALTVDVEGLETDIIHEETRAGETWAKGFLAGEGQAAEWLGEAGHHEAAKFLRARASAKGAV